MVGSKSRTGSAGGGAPRATGATFNPQTPDELDTLLQTLTPNTPGDDNIVDLTTLRNSLNPARLRQLGRTREDVLRDALDRRGTFQDPSPPFLIEIQ